MATRLRAARPWRALGWRALASGGRVARDELRATLLLLRAAGWRASASGGRIVRKVLRATWWSSREAASFEPRGGELWRLKDALRGRCFARVGCRAARRRASSRGAASFGVSETRRAEGASRDLVVEPRGGKLRAAGRRALASPRRITRERGRCFARLGCRAARRRASSRGAASFGVSETRRAEGASRDLVVEPRGGELRAAGRSSRNAASFEPRGGELWPLRDASRGRSFARPCCCFEPRGGELRRLEDASRGKSFA